jgi:eukaryotic-like serine/threonine-protein kinase
VGREELLPGNPSPTGGDVVADRYVLERSLGNGGMGEVWVATDRKLRRRVALKELSPALAEDEPARVRFFREARALARISHPNVVGVFDVGEDDGRPFLVMELVEGRTLEDELQRVGPFSPERTAAIGAGIAAGLAAAHENGVIHRDVKPSNIFLTSTDEPKVGDFGIARFEVGDKTATLTGAVFGSPAYVSPEQVNGGKVGPRADLYALGCVLYRMLAGRPPFEGDPVALTYQHVHEQPPAVDTDRVPPDLAALIAALLEKDPGARPRTAEEVRTALSAFVAQPTRPLTPPPPLEPTGVLPAIAPEPRRRWPWPIVAIAATALLLIGLMGWAFARWGGNDSPARRTASPRAAASSQQPSPRSSTASSASPTTASTTTASPTVSPTSDQSASATLTALVQALELSGQIDPHLANAIDHTITDVQTKLDQPDEARAALDHLREEVQKSVDHRQLSVSTARRLLFAIDLFSSTLPTDSSGEGD